MHKIVVVLLCLVVLIAAVVGMSRSAATQPAVTYEYKFVGVHFDGCEVSKGTLESQDKLNKYARDGWRVAQMNREGHPQLYVVLLERRR